MFVLLFFVDFIIIDLFYYYDDKSLFIIYDYTAVVPSFLSLFITRDLCTAVPPGMVEAHATAEYRSAFCSETHKETKRDQYRKETWLYLFTVYMLLLFNNNFLTDFYLLIL